MSFLEDFQANLESLPNMLQRKYTLLRDLDKSLQDIQHQNEQRCEQEIEEMKHEIKSGNITPNASNIRFSDEALDEQKHAVRIADEKVALAVQAYDLVDAHIQQLDQYLRKIDEELRSERESVAVTGSAAQNLNSNVKSRRGSESGRGGRKKRIYMKSKAPICAGLAEAQQMQQQQLQIQPVWIWIYQWIPMNPHTVSATK
ncbi:PHD finger protein ING1-like isoform X2 [Camellia sinensis]|uniref:PHD finger protein ING1-like isoform X2 n=1 Tax=Camellia sinensis TaxID=4442 RepID=UPI00103585AD|nr:PHD finger protein ING1-like isoform X2 [Camellia sinensis]